MKEEVGDLILCYECGRVLNGDPGDWDDGYDGIWFDEEDSPTGEPICSECFDKLPCDGCKGL